MKNKKTNYQVTIGYRAVITVPVKADSEEEAKEKGLAEFAKSRTFGKCNLEDDNYKVQGCLNMDETWNAI